MNFIAFILFVLCCFNLFCRYLSNYDAKKQFFFEVIDQKPNPPHPWKDKKRKFFFSFKKKTHYFSRRLARPFQPPKKKTFFFLSSPFILQHKHLSSLKQPCKTSITIKPSNLHISLKSSPNRKLSLPKQFHTSHQT